MFSLICTQANGRRDFAMPQYATALTRATVEIIEDFYIDRTNTLNFYHASNELDDKGLERNLDVMNEILNHIKSKVAVQVEGYSEFKITNRKRRYNIFFIDSYESFWRIFRLMSPAYFDYQGFYLLVLTNYSYQQYQIMMSIFEYLWAEYVINVNIIWLAPQNDEEAIMYTYFPYTKFFCGKAVPIQLNQFRFGKWMNVKAEYFPEKVANLHGCPLTVATVVTPPFMILEKGPNGQLLPDGIDGVLLRVLSQRMNFSVDIVQVDSQGVIMSNGRVTGAIKMVIEKEANFTLGYLSSTVSRNLLMQSSYIYYTSNLVWSVPPGRLFTSLEKLYKPFRIVLWSCILALFGLCFVFIRIFRAKSTSLQNFVFGKGNSSPCLNISNIFLGGSLHRLPVTNFARYILGTFMIYCLIIRSSYQGEYSKSFKIISLNFIDFYFFHFFKAHFLTL